jgi:hypothetical protein
MTLHALSSTLLIRQRDMSEGLREESAHSYVSARGVLLRVSWSISAVRRGTDDVDELNSLLYTTSQQHHSACGAVLDMIQWTSATSPRNLDDVEQLNNLLEPALRRQYLARPGASGCRAKHGISTHRIGASAPRS